jgi:L-amino acid N-acyltransferase YncA
MMNADTPSVGPADSERDLEGILALQNECREPTPDGFVTVAHTLDVLRAMQALAPSIVARDAGGRVVGYALAMPIETRALIPILEPMFRMIETLPALAICGGPRARWYVMGQIAIAPAHRGTGLFARLYDEHRARYRAAFDAIVTEVSTSNARSLRAHARVGFKTIAVYRDATDEWALMAWAWD